MRVKEWHKLVVGGEEVFHDLERVYYRRGNTRMAIGGVWYCVECDDIVDMRGLSEKGFQRARNLSGRYTSMFERGLRFQRKWRSFEPLVKKVSKVEVSVLAGGESNVAPSVELEPGKIVASSSPEPPDVLPSASKEKEPRIMGHHPCPCGSGKKYRDCCRPKLL